MKRTRLLSINKSRWADSKVQFAKTKDTILKLFKNQEKDEPHN